MVTENPNNFRMSERYLQVDPLLCHVADELINDLSAHPGQAPASTRAPTITVRHMPEVACSIAAALPRRRQRDRRTETEEPAGLRSARVVTSRKKNHG